MATYGLKYKAEWRNSRGQDYRLRIYRRDYTGTSKTIGAFCGCVLEVQGAQGRIIDPIVKTQLRFSMVDAWDQADTSSVKFGDWQEFYTPDATLYKVVLYSLSGSSATALWTGYITPDSWHEDLDYHGIITVTARDNIGHLNDFPFEMTPNTDGLIKISDLIDRAMEVIDFAMDYTIARAGLGPTSLNNIVADGVYLHETYVSASIFEGSNWYEALEKTLEATGMTLRYVGQNKVEITYLRNQTYMGSPYAQPDRQVLEFYGGSLELDPAVKQIDETVDFGIKKDITLDIRSGITYGTAKTYKAHIDGSGSGWSIDYGVVDSPYNKLSGSGCTVNSASDSMDPSRLEPLAPLVKKEGDTWDKYTFLPVNCWHDPLDLNPPTPPAIYMVKAVHDTQMVIRVAFADPLTIIGDKFARMPMALAEATFAISYSDSSLTNGRYWDGQEWVEAQGTPVTIRKTFDWNNKFVREIEFSLKSCDDIGFNGVISFAIYDMQYKVVQDYSFSNSPHGVYARIQSLVIETNAILVESDKITTRNNDAYNVLISRSPLFGAISRDSGFILAENYKKAIFYYPSAGIPQQYPYMVRFNGQATGSEVPLPVLIHQQILCYYFGAARVLSGNCAPADKARYNFHAIAMYKGVKYLLQGGTLDLFSGIMSGAVFREYATFDDLWSDTQPEYSEEVKYNT